MGISRGSVWSKTFKIVSRTTGEPLTLGRLKASFRDEAGVDPILTLTTENGGISKPATGQFTLTLNSTQTAQFTEDSYLFAVYDVDDDNRRLLKGTILFEDAI
jgi:hypothetical protein